MTELTDDSGAFGYGESILVGERVRLRGVRDDDLPTLAKWEMDPGRMAMLSSLVAPPSEAAAKEQIGKWSANEKDDLGFAIETLDDPPVLVLHDGRWYDEVLMSILDHEWAARRSPTEGCEVEPGLGSGS